MNPPGLLTASEAAAILGLSARHVRRLVAEGQLAEYRLGQSLVFERAAVDRLAEERRRNPPRVGRPPRQRPEAIDA